MAVSGEICRVVLESLKDQSVALTASLSGADPEAVRLTHAAAIATLKQKLMAQYPREDIEDSLCFLEKRGYVAVPGLAYCLTDKALRALETGTFSQQEQQAFSAALINCRRAGGRGGLISGLRNLFRRLKKSSTKKS